MRPEKIYIRNNCEHGTAEHVEELFRMHFPTISIEQGGRDESMNDLIVCVGNLDDDTDAPPSGPRLAVVCERCATGNTADGLSKSGDYDDVVFAPFKPQEFVFRVHRLLGPSATEIESAKKNLLMKFGMGRFIGEDPSFLAVLEKLPLLGNSEATILLAGETGVGKEVCARALHYLSGRASHPFVAINCGALPANLAENELFGHKKGAFTDARNDKQGLIAEAEGGTLFLDEINSLSLETQSKLLRLLQEKNYRPLGHTRDINADIRILAATNRDLYELVRNGSFREDLYYRLTVTLRLPSLRERRSDIPLLAEHFIRKYTPDGGKRKRLSPSAIQKLMIYDWPGNIRELENVIQQAVLLSPASLIAPGDIPLTNMMHGGNTRIQPFKLAKEEAVARFESEYVRRLLVACGGNITSAAAAARKDRGDFSRLVKKYRLDLTRLHP